eukprot:6383226-Alexandrium_andersonii.AAC.1
MLDGRAALPRGESCDMDTDEGAPPPSGPAAAGEVGLQPSDAGSVEMSSVGHGPHGSAGTPMDGLPTPEAVDAR